LLVPSLRVKGNKFEAKGLAKRVLEKSIGSGERGGDFHTFRNTAMSSEISKNMSI